MIGISGKCAGEKVFHTVDYIVIHELMHLHERHHKQVFGERVGQAMPDYAKCKRWLAENGSIF